MAPTPVSAAVPAANVKAKNVPQGKKNKKWTWKKPKGKPNRPLSAYNLFFRRERSSELARRSLVTGKEGIKIGFADLAKTVAKRWKGLDAEKKSAYEVLASEEKKRYFLELAAWKTMNRQRQFEGDEREGQKEPTASWGQEEESDERGRIRKFGGGLCEEEQGWESPGRVQTHREQFCRHHELVQPRSRAANELTASPPLSTVADNPPTPASSVAQQHQEEAEGTIFTMAHHHLPPVPTVAEAATDPVLSDLVKSNYAWLCFLYFGGPAPFVASLAIPPASGGPFLPPLTMAGTADSTLLQGSHRLSPSFPMDHHLSSEYFRLLLNESMADARQMEEAFIHPVSAGSGPLVPDVSVSTQMEVDKEGSR